MVRSLPMVVRRKQERKEEKEKVRRALLRATLKLASSYGFPSLSLREVAREAGIAPTSSSTSCATSRVRSAQATLPSNRLSSRRPSSLHSKPSKPWVRLAGHGDERLEPCLYHLVQDGGFGLVPLVAVAQCCAFGSARDESAGGTVGDGTGTIPTLWGEQ